jgi:HEPN domain-containing protein
VISIAELRAIAKARLDDATLLFTNQRPDGALYLGGYAVELALKARICTTLNWSGFPETRNEFDGYGSFKTHKLDVLLRLSGQETRIKSEYLWAWSAVTTWDPEARYRPIGRTPQIDVALLLVAAEALLDML